MHYVNDFFALNWQGARGGAREGGAPAARGDVREAPRGQALAGAGAEGLVEVDAEPREPPEQPCRIFCNMNNCCNEKAAT